MKKQKLVPMPGLDKLEELAKRRELIRELERLHREQRGWQRLVNDEELNYELLESMPLDKLEQAVILIREG